MGHKKRISKPHSSPAVSGTKVPRNDAVSTDSPEPRNENPTAAVSAVKQECERALNALRRGNHTRALKVMKDACVKYDNSGLVYRVQGTVCVNVASVIDDSTVKQRHLRNGINSARRAVELSPDSIEFAHFYANLLYEVASGGREYEEVVAECERALAIENPVDPAKESLLDESQHKILSSQSRIEHVRSELRSLIQKSNIGSFSTWMKSFGNGEEKFRLIPIRRAAEDPMEVGLVQGRRTNEIKRANKTLEEKRKEIEVRVAAARLLQQKSESGELLNGSEKGVDANLRSGQSQQSAGDRTRRKSSRKRESNSERRDWVRSYWDSMRFDKKKELLAVRISDLKAHFGSSKYGLENEVLSEALRWGETNKTWKFWACCKCGEKFLDAESHMQHFVQDHMGNLMPELRSVLPKGVDNETADMLLSSSWKPLNVSAAVEILGGELKSCDSELVEDTYSANQTEEMYDGCFKDLQNSSPDNGKAKAYLNDSIVPDIGCDKNECDRLRDFDGNQQFLSCSLADDNWPVSDDAERGKLLEKVYTFLETLIRNKCLSERHLKKVMQFTMTELHCIFSGSKFLNHFMDQTPVCICFLGTPQLRSILKFLQDVSHSCGLVRYSENCSSAVDDANNTAQVPEIKERIILTDDASRLILDQQLLSNKSTEGSSSLISKDDAAFIHDSDLLLSWIFADLMSGEQLTSWNNMKKEKTRQGMDILQALEKEFFHLQDLCGKKIKNLGYEEALQAVGDLCLAEVKKRDGITESVHESLDSVLRKRKEELADSERDVMSSSSRFELDTISNILKEAEALNVNLFGYEETCNGVTSQLYDLESGEGGDWKTKNYWQQLDTCIKDSIERQKEQLSTELSNLDARLLRNVSEMQLLELKIQPVSEFDYRLILVPLLKSYLRAHLEFLAEKDAREKSDAATEAFLAELALDSKKSVKGGADKHAHEKPKDKKKNKESKKAKDFKPTNGAAVGTLPYANAGMDCSLDTFDQDHRGPEKVFPASIDDFRQEDEEFRHKIEHEEEERKLEEMLEYQRRLEDETKMRFLSNQKKNSETYLDEVETVQHFYPEFKSGDQDELEPLKLCMLEKMVEEIEEAKDLAEPLNTANSALIAIKCSAICDVQNHSIHKDEYKQVVPNGGSLENGFLSSDRRTGRKNRRKKNMVRMSDVRCQTISLDKDTKDVSCTVDDNSVKELAGSSSSLNNVSACHSGESEIKLLRQLKEEDDDEERFQADFKKAVRQSLDTFHAHQKLPSVSNFTMQQEIPLVDSLGMAPSYFTEENGNGMDVFGTGLRNEVGEYNCFLNVIIQSLWHLRQFRDEFLRRSTSDHLHVLGDPCVVCALYDIFTALGMSSTETQREAVSPTPLRVALSNLYPSSNFFQVGEMNDASEVLGVIFDRLHEAFTLGVSDGESVGSHSYGARNCAKSACIAHSLFGMDIFERMSCYKCGVESRHLKYTSFFHNINASALRKVKDMYPESSFEELLNLVEMNDQLTCDPEVGGCGTYNYIHHTLLKPPRVFTTVLGWQNTCENVEHIKATLAALSTVIDISALYRGLHPKNIHKLISVVCYYGQHYHCFAFSHDHQQWIMYDDKTVKIVGGWNDVISICERGHLQPQVLFFEAAS